jgi:hypothetical protein
MRVWLLVLLCGCSEGLPLGDAGEPPTDMALGGGADLAGIDLTGVDLSSIDLSEGDLSQGDLSGVDLLAMELVGADLSPLPCPLRPMGEWHVSPSGSDVGTLYVGNGSATCPLQTLTRALTLAKLDGFSATIFLHRGNGAPPTYIGGAIALRPGQSLKLQGDGIADVSVLNGTLQVNGGSAPDTVTIAGLSLTQGPSASGGEIGIDIVSDAGIAVEDVAISGDSLHLASGIKHQGTGVAILGPGLSIIGGQFGVVTAQGSTAVLVGTAQRPTSLRDQSTECVTSVSSVSGNVTLTNCGKRAIVGVPDISGTVVVGGGDGLNAAITTTGTVSQVQITGYQGDGISCNGCTIQNNVQVMGTLIGAGVHVTAGAANISGLLATGNHVDGLRCEGTSTLKLRGSTFTGNDANGLLAFGNCALDLGTGIDPGNNRFNRTGAKNGVSGLCLLQAASTSLSMSSCEFSCGYVGTGCVSSGTPATVMASTCQVADMTLGPGLSLSTSGSSCCN